MEDWQKEFMAMLETVTITVEDFFEEVGQAIEEIAQEVHDEIITNLEQSLELFFEPDLESHFEEENFIAEQLFEDTEFILNPKIEPSATVHPACIGCCHYHGRVYGENVLICAMHPYGWDDTKCPDWQGSQQ